MDSPNYTIYQERKFREFESACKRCGECCGSMDGDPCSNLVKEAAGKYSCAVYDKRFGPQKTLSGKMFTCVPIREMVSRECLRPACAYNTEAIQ